MRDGYNKLVRSIEELEQRKDAAKAKISMAKAQTQINRTAAKAGSVTALEAFDRYEQKAEKMLAQANVETELNAESAGVEDLTDKYAGGTGSTAVDEELAAMRDKLGL